MNIEEKDYLEIAKTRITEQFKGKETLESLMEMWLEGYQEIQAVILDLFDVLDIDTARGEQLDIIGAIVGQPREVVAIDALGYFGFEGDTSALSFGSTENNEGGVYYSIRDPLTGSVVLSDRLYRAFIRAKIISNNAGSTGEDIIRAAKQVFQTGYVELTENGDTSISLNIGRRAWNDPEESAFPGLDEASLAQILLPFPAGVDVDFVNTPQQPDPSLEVNNWNQASLDLYNTAHVVLPANLNNTF